MPQPPNVSDVGERIERLLDELGALTDPITRAKAEELVRLLVDLYGAGLDHIMRAVTEAEAAAVLQRFVDDDLVAGLLILHDLHPLDVEERIRAALDEVRPYLGLHSGGVELTELTDEGTVRLRLEGTCHGCPSSRITVTQAIERAVLAAAPEVSGIEVEGLAEPAPAASELLQIQPKPPGPCPVPEQPGGPLSAEASIR
ncbi:Fe-S cluster biogenesis protein NfuA, 4Fe-4S-binding domain [Sinosporangium album]|uniref:Fe-S cluster biogenesis protein NfuA, 4Fe-4S-binding domain n=1 Tax=Sinosporangium album TaxID=504805 RepID=A0A1G8HIT0_9ACTN|nr:NifU family protein [Sinosporangium album]SDI06360.1 Fe-S cluster biogenesis protein NfuA, 4Fe-4S-binding domain [Sinosporangium album]